jgi:MFS family permease
MSPKTIVLKPQPIALKYLRTHTAQYGFWFCFSPPLHPFFMESGSSRRLFTGQFWILSISSFLFFASFNMVVPELPDYLTAMGGEDYKGFIIAMFTLAAGISRPFSGKLTDSIGRVPVILFGTFMTAFCGLLYPWFTSLGLFFFLRFLHGFSTGFAPTGSTAYIGDVAPVHRRGEAIGWVSMFGTLGMAMGPALGSLVANNLSVNAMFYTASICGFVALAITWPLKETLPNPKKFSLALFKITKADFYEPRVLRPAAIYMLISFSFGAMLTLVPDLSKHVGIANKGWFFTTFTLCSLLSRFMAGKLSDRIGRIKTMRIGAALLTIAMVVLGMATGPVLFFTSAVLFGVAVGTNSPTIMAWTIDLSEDKYRGRALSTVYIALEIGIGGGALLSGWLYNNKPENFVTAFAACAILCLTALILLFIKMKPTPKKPTD